MQLHCSKCSRPIELTDTIESNNGQPAHLVCQRSQVLKLSGPKLRKNFARTFDDRLTTIRAKLPFALKRSGRAVINAIDARWRLWRLVRLAASLRATPGAFDDSRILAAMRSAWGNEGWSADLGYIQALARRMAHVTSSVLECGSGLTTIVSGVLAERRDVQVLSLEQDPWWANFVQSRLRRLNITQVAVVHAPLIAYDGFMWFDVAAVKFPESFELVICDGPMILGQDEPYQSAWRVGLLPVLRDRGVRVGEVLLDDAEGARLNSIRAVWEGQHHFSIRITPTATGDYLTASR